MFHGRRFIENGNQPLREARLSDIPHSTFSFSFLLGASKSARKSSKNIHSTVHLSFISGSVNPDPMASLSCILPGALYLSGYVTTSLAFLPISNTNCLGRHSPASLHAAMEPELLTEHNITHTVSILQDWPSTGPHHLSIHLDDAEMENLLVQLPRVCDFIDQAVASGGVVLVHCLGGVSRSASCVIAYCAYEDAELVSAEFSRLASVKARGELTYAY